MASLNDILAQKTEEPSSSDNDFDEFDGSDGFEEEPSTIPVIPKRPVRSTPTPTTREASEEERGTTPVISSPASNKLVEEEKKDDSSHPQIQNTEGSESEQEREMTPVIPQRPNKVKKVVNEEEEKKETTPVIPQRPKKVVKTPEPSDQVINDEKMDESETDPVVDDTVKPTIEAIEKTANTSSVSDPTPVIPERPQRTKNKAVHQDVIPDVTESTEIKSPTTEYVEKANRELEDLKSLHEITESTSSDISDTPGVPEQPINPIVRSTTDDLKDEVLALYNSKQDIDPTIVDSNTTSTPTIPSRPASKPLARVSTADLKEEVVSLYKSKSSITSGKPSSSSSSPPPSSRSPTPDQTESKPKSKGPPPIPKKPSSKIAAFQEMLRKNQERERQEQEQTTPPLPSSRPKPRSLNSSSDTTSDSNPTTSTNRNAFKQNLNGLFALPGMAMPGSGIPSSIQKKLQPPSEESDESKTTESGVDTRKSRAKGPRGKRLPKSAANTVVVEDKRIIKVFDVWSTSECNGFVLKKEIASEADKDASLDASLDAVADTKDILDENATAKANDTDTQVETGVEPIVDEPTKAGEAGEADEFIDAPEDPIVKDVELPSEEENSTTNAETEAVPEIERLADEAVEVELESAKAEADDDDVDEQTNEIVATEEPEKIEETLED